MSETLDNFERAFSNSSAGCVRECSCGKLYYDDVQSYDWCHGELERLRSDPNAVPLDYAPGDISFEGRFYVDACGCWYARAQKLMSFIDTHSHKIAKYLSLEKQRKQQEAERSPTVD